MTFDPSAARFVDHFGYLNKLQLATVEPQIPSRLCNLRLSYQSHHAKNKDTVTYGEVNLPTINHAHRFAIVVVLSHVSLSRVDGLGTGSLIDLLTFRRDIVGTSNGCPDCHWRWLSIRIVNALEELL